LTDDDTNEVEWITGEDRLIHWKNCNITIFVMDSNGKRDKGTKCPKREGDWKVPSGIELYCFGGKLRVT